MKGDAASFSRWALPGFMLLSSLVLLIIGVPRFLAELALVPGTLIYDRISSGEFVENAELTVVEESRLQALEFAELPKAYTDLGTVYLTRAQRATKREDKTNLARKSIVVTTEGLRLAPLNTFAWSRLSVAHILLGQDHHDKAIEAWRTSVASARFEPLLLTQRLHIGIILYGSMSEQDQSTLRDQFKLTFDWRRGDLRAYARQYQLVDWMVLLAGDDVKAIEYLRK